MQIKGLAHVAFNVADMDRSLDFYCNKLGMRQVFIMKYEDLLRMLDVFDEANQEAPAELAEMKEQIQQKKDQVWMTYLEFAPGQFIELFATDPGTPIAERVGQRVGYQHFALEVEDIQKAKAELIAAGIPIERDASLAVDNTWQLWIADPDGNAFELHQYTPASLQLL